MKKNKIKSKRREYDTFSITMELERPLIEDAIKQDEKNTKTKRKLNKKKLFSIFIVLILMIAGGFFIWLSNFYIPTSEAKLYLKDSSSVEVNIEDNLIVFTPKNSKPKKGVIFYPEAKVEAKAYSKLCSMIAENGYKVVAVDMPFNFASFGKNKAKGVINDYPDIEKWVIAGDSLGGEVAAEYVGSNMEKINGVILISSYPNNSQLKEINMDVLSIWGSKDGVIKFQSLIDAKERLPKKTSYVEIEGANHSQFGDYGIYKGDEEAIISSDEQKEKALNSILKFLEAI